MMELATVIPFRDHRTEQVAVPRAALSAAAENAVGASRSAADALERALGHIFASNRAGAVHEIERARFELDQRLPNLLVLTRLSEDAPALVDGSWKPARSNGAA